MGAVKFTPEIKVRIIARIRAGNHPEIACRSLGVAYNTIYKGAKAGDPEMVEFQNLVSQTVARGEVEDVCMTAKAARTSKIKVDCPHCHREFSADTAALARINSAVQEQQVLESKAKTALARLERRFGKRWSPRVVHTVEQQHQELLDVAARVLDEKAYDLLIDAYIASRDGEGSEGEPTSEPTAGGVH